jgi:hypothetical protein
MKPWERIGSVITFEVDQRRAAGCALGIPVEKWPKQVIEITKTTHTCSGAQVVRRFPR